MYWECAQARCQDFAARGDKNTQVGSHFKIQLLMYAANGGPNMKLVSGHHWPPTGDDPGMWSDSPLPFWLFSL